MPYKCSVPACKGNYSDAEKVHVFSFPSDPDLKKAWERAIPRKDFVYSKNSKVCEKHFMPEEIERESKAFNEQLGETITVPLLRIRLKQGAVPKIFPGCPSYFNNNKTLRQSPSAKRKKIEEDLIAKSIVLSIESQQKYEEERTFSSFEELINHFKEYRSSFWDVVVKSNALLFLRLVIFGGKTELIYAICINEELELSVSFRGQPVNKFNHWMYPTKSKKY